MKYTKEFLIKLSTQKHQTKYARITVLDINDNPLEVLEGKVTGGGPISIDGNSAVRRTCSLQMVADREDTMVTDAYWSLSNKFKIEIGLLNNIDDNYPSIIWLNQGIYAISSFNYSIQAASINISISGKDKMTLLNGELGGIFPVSTKIDTIEQVNKDGSVIYEKQKIYDIIVNLLHLYAGEPLHNIIINDLPEYGYELWDYRGSTEEGKEFPMYYFRDAKDEQIKNLSLDGDKLVYKVGTSEGTSILYFVNYNEATGTIEFVTPDKATATINSNDILSLSNMPDSYMYNKSTEFTHTGIKVTLSENSTNEYYIQKIAYGYTAGYHKTSLIYPGDLIANAGENIVSILDKIKSILGDFEYFYDIDGKFIFQKKKIYVKNLFSPINDNSVEPFIEISPYSYSFEDDSLFTGISHNPAISNVKNDFIIQGNKRSENGGDKLPIQARYAIDKKPRKYKTFNYYKKCFDLTYIKEAKRAFEIDNTVMTIKQNIKPENSCASYYIIEENSTYKKSSIQTIIEKFSWDGLNSGIKNGKYKINGIVKNENSSDSYSYKCLYENNQTEVILYVGDLLSDKAYIGDTIEIKSKESDEYNIYLYTTNKSELYYLIKSTLPAGEGTQLYLLDKERADLADNQNFETRRYFIEEDNIFKEISNIKNLDETYYLAEPSMVYYSDYYNGTTESEWKKVDWRELIWLMQRDYYQHNENPKFELDLIENNPEFAAARRTGYEQYYADMQAFWRDLYDPNGKSPKYIVNGDIEAKQFLHWARAVIYYPETLNYWIDFLDTGGPIDKYSIQAIGRRPKVEQANVSGVTAIFYHEVPDVEFTVLPVENNDDDSTNENDMALQKIYIQDNMQQLFNISSRGKTASTRADELIWQYACGSEAVTFTAIPLYFLEPDTQIKYKNEDYIVTKITIPLTYNGTMQITATKIIKPI